MNKKILIAIIAMIIIICAGAFAFTNMQSGNGASINVDTNALEEKGNLFSFQIPKNVYYIPDDDVNINEDVNIVKLKRWLKEFKMENYLNNFLNNGYYTVELFLFQMISKNPINNDILQNEIGIDKIGHRSRILSILKEECKNIQDKLENKGENVIDIMDEVNNCGCLIM